MDKLNDLRGYLLAQIPQLERNPEQLLMYIENGKIRFHKSAPQNYSHRYTMPLSIIITDWQGSVDPLVIALCQWLAVREPGFDPEETLSFECEIIAQDKIDVQFTLQISERVIVKYDATTNTQTIEHVLPEPELQMNPDAVLDMESLENE